MTITRLVAQSMTDIMLQPTLMSVMIWKSVMREASGSATVGVVLVTPPPGEVGLDGLTSLQVYVCNDSS